MTAMVIIGVTKNHRGRHHDTTVILGDAVTAKVILGDAVTAVVILGYTVMAMVIFSTPQ